jgi:hypothetical protein
MSDGYPGEWIATLEKVLALGATRFVPGHGSLATVDDVEDQIAYLRWLRAAVEPFVREGQSLDAAKAAIELPDKYADYPFAWHLASGIERVYAELTEAGEGHAPEP